MNCGTNRPGLLFHDFAHRMATSHTINYVLIILVAVAFRDHACSLECGSVYIVRDLMRGGNAVLRNEWPFIVAVYEVNPIKYICGGTLISNRHILTAAHCIHRRHSNVKLSADDIKVRLGAYNLTVESEIGTVNRNISAVFVNPDWKPDADRFDADLAILVLSENVTFSIYIQPICIPTNDVVIDGAVIDVNGTVVGWGLADDTRHEEVPRKIVATALTNSLCYRSEPSIVKSTSFRSFCARGQDGTPNKGDSGGGFFVLSKSSWVQYGIVSAIHASTKQFSIYTNLKAFKRFIVETVTETGGEIGESTMKVHLNCTYSNSDDGNYTCSFNKLEVRYEHNEIDKVDGVHGTGNGNENVGSIEFNSGFMFTLPDGLGRVFENVKTIRIGNSNSSLGLRRIWRSSLTNLKGLLVLDVKRNEIELLDEDCLWDLPSLEIFRLVDNELKELHELTFDKNKQLTEVHLSGNRLETLPKRLFASNQLLNYIDLENNSLRIIDEQIFMMNRHVLIIDLSSNRLESLPRDLFKHNFFLSSLSLYNNSLTTIDEQMFHRNLRLDKVYLSANRLIELPKNLFRSCELLEQVFLDQNSLTSIDETLFDKNVMLTTIYISSNRLEYLPKNMFKNNSALQLLAVGNNMFRTLDENIFQMNEEIRQINFAFCRLEYLPSDLLKNKFFIRSVNFGSNSLTEIPEPIFHRILLLRTVLLQFNKLESLPKSLFRNNALLQDVFVDNNRLKTLDEKTFERNLKLKVVSLGSNRLEHLPQNLFTNNLDIVSVNISDNCLLYIDADLFATNLNLKYVGISSNRLESLPTPLFRNNSRLKIIDIHNNSLATIDESIFETNVRLTYVGLSTNHLVALPKNLFKNNLVLERISLFGNSLKTIDERIFAMNPNLKTVLLTSNQLEYLPSNLFNSNALLEEVHFKRNLLRIVDIDFKQLGHINVIEMSNNTCIDAIYSNKVDTSKYFTNHFRNVTKFQELLKTNCSLT
ncbi:leucine-rich repeat and death domain-containing protein 1-like [Bradysia coprophila]|uniref:leucine-rich repeat and death domain-containing protein 1-like n=1 Tax=Bradysia coprophila TaxID=38358 RepID=UPI00187D79BB|nr:leucine-rich repeat and death domain-containing protein 1-like [Bradysia coprophila]